MQGSHLLPGTSHPISTRQRSTSNLPKRASQFGVDSSHAGITSAEGDGSGEEKENDLLISTRKRASTKSSIHRSFVPFAKDTEEPYEIDTSEHDSSSHQHTSPPPTIVNPTTVIRYTIDEILSFSYSISGTGAISSLLLLFYYGLFTGGPAVLIWGWLIAAFFSAIVVANIAEICSAYPRNAGSVYYWTGQLAPKEYAPIIAYWTGIFALFAYTAYASSYAYGFAILFSSALFYSGYDELSNTSQVGIAVLIIWIWGLICYSRINYRDIISHISSFLQISLALAIIIAVTVGATRFNKAEYVFLTGVNPSFSDGFYQISFILAVGVVSSWYGLSEFSARDGALHTGLDEDASADTEITSSGAVLHTGIVTGVLGLSLILALLFTVDITDPNGTINSTAIEVVNQTDGGTAAIGFAWYAACVSFFCGLCHVPTGIALLHALAKDNLLPMSATWFSQLDASLYPTYAMILFCLLTSLVLLGELIESENGDITVGGSHMAFFSILQTCNFAFQVSFAIPILLKITCICPMAYRALTKGGWYLESASFPLGVIAFSWLALTALLELLPMKYPVTASNMNYTVVIVAFVMLLGELNWEFNCRYHFRGPKRSDDDVDYGFYSRRMSTVY